MIINPDFDNTALDYKKYRQGFPEQFFNKLNKIGIGLKGQKVLDIGTGTGTVARGFALVGCNVTAIDIAEKLIEQAKEIDKTLGVNIHYEIASAENTRQMSHQFDVIIAGQTWHWLNNDETIREIKRIIKRGGTLVIAHYDWLPLKGSVPALSEKLILKYNPAWGMAGGNGFYPLWLTQLVEAGFEQVETYSFDHVAEYSHEAWLGRVRASAAISASLNEDRVRRFNEDHSNLLKNFFPEEPLKILHRCFTVIAKAFTFFKPKYSKVNT